MDIDALRLFICDERPDRLPTEVDRLLTLLISWFTLLPIVVRDEESPPTLLESVVIEPPKPVTADCTLPIAVVRPLFIDVRAEERPVTFFPTP